MATDRNPETKHESSRSLMKIMQRGFARQSRRRAPASALSSSLESLENRTVPNTGLLAGIDPMLAYAYAAPPASYDPYYYSPPLAYAAPPMAPAAFEAPPLASYFPAAEAFPPAMPMPTPPLAYAMPPLAMPAMMPEAFNAGAFAPAMASALPPAAIAAPVAAPPVADPPPVSALPAMMTWTGAIPSDPPPASAPLAGGAGALASASINPPSFPGIAAPSGDMGGGAPVAAAPPAAAMPPLAAPATYEAPPAAAYVTTEAPPAAAFPPAAAMPPLAAPATYEAPAAYPPAAATPPMAVAVPEHFATAPTYEAPPAAAFPPTYYAPPAYEAPPAAAMPPLASASPEHVAPLPVYEAPPAAALPEEHIAPEPVYEAPPAAGALPEGWVYADPSGAIPADVYAAPPVVATLPPLAMPPAEEPPAAAPLPGWSTGATLPGYAAPPDASYSTATAPQETVSAAAPPAGSSQDAGALDLIGFIPPAAFPPAATIGTGDATTPPAAGQNSTGTVPQEVPPVADPVAPPYAGSPTSPAYPQKPNNPNQQPIDYDAALLWHVILKPGAKIEQLVAELGLGAVTPSGLIENSYLFQRPAHLTGAQLAAALRGDARVSAYEMLIEKQQTTRAVPNDPLYVDQWHLNNTGQFLGTPGEDINVQSVWDTYRGSGSTIAVVDDGLQFTHPDLAANYRADVSYDFNGNDNDPTPSAGDSHGTAVAGVAAGVGFNGIGITGVAPEASLAGIRLIAAPTTDIQEAAALTYQSDEIDIYSNSWGPSDDGDLDAMGRLVQAALALGVTQGRGGLGNIYVWAGGNGAQSNDNVNYDGYASSRYVIAVGAVDNNGERSVYSEPGAALFVSAPASFTDSNGNSPGTWTTTLVGTGDQSDGTLPLSNDYTSDFNGTSSATPVVSGVVALMLEANPNLTWRDVKHILARTARQNDPTNSGWSTNGAGFHINHEYGFGVVDAAAAVALAETWVNVGPEVVGGSGLIVVDQPIVDPDPSGDPIIPITPLTTAVAIRDDITIETVEITVNITHTFRGDLSIKLISPDGTVSILAEPRLNDSDDNYDNWTFTTNRSWGENSAGIWKLVIEDVFTADEGTLDSWELKIYGTGTVAPPIPEGWETIIENTNPF